MKLRRLTTSGISKFSLYLDQLETEPKRLVPEQLITSIEDSELVHDGPELEKRRFGSRLAAAKYLDEQFTKSGLNEVERDAGLWSWLALYYFDELCPADSGGSRSVGERARYIAEPAYFRRYYRHLLLGPFKIYSAHRDDPARAMALLCQPLHIIDDIIAQLAAYYELVSNKSVVEVATTLYIDLGTGKRKKGAGGKGAGSPRRLADILNQFDVTWDLYGMNVSELLGVLPKEFDRFRTVHGIGRLGPI